MAEKNNGGKLAAAADVKEINIDDLISKKEEETPTEVFGGDIKGLDANRYATKKTVAQGMLDIALLTSNASQLKYVLQVGPKHEFYTLLVTLISISMVLQVAMALVLMSLNLLRDCRFHLPRHRTSALNINYMTTATAFLVTAGAGILAIILSSLDPDSSQTQKKIADWLYHISVGLMTVAVFCDVIKMTFGLDPAVSQQDLNGNKNSSFFGLF